MHLEVYVDGSASFCCPLLSWHRKRARNVACGAGIGGGHRMTGGLPLFRTKCVLRPAPQKLCVCALEKRPVLIKWPSLSYLLEMSQVGGLRCRSA